MLHKVPKLLAATSGLFVVGVLVYTATDQFDDSNLRGQLAMSSFMSSEVVSDDGPWLDPENDMAPVDLETFIFSDASSTELGGTTGGAVMMGDSAGAAPTSPKPPTTPPPPPSDSCAPKAEKKLNGKEVCKCGKSADDLQAAYTAKMKNLLKNLRAPQCAAECPQDDSISPNPKNTVNGPTIIRTHVAGKGDPPDKKWKNAGCKITELVACFKATGDATSERFCKKKGSSSTSTSSSSSSTSSSSTSSSSSSVTPPSSPPRSANGPSSGYRCCRIYSAQAYCQQSNIEKCNDGDYPSGSWYSTIESCNQSCPKS